METDVCQTKHILYVCQILVRYSVRFNLYINWIMWLQEATRREAILLYIAIIYSRRNKDFFSANINIPAQRWKKKGPCLL